MSHSSLEIYIDGAAKGNPGPAGVGIVISQSGETIRNISSYIGSTTNNLAEYTALLYALQEALILKAKKVKVYTDSELLCRQINKEYKVRDPKIQILYGQAEHIISAFDNFSVTHIGREKNCGADKLANLAVKKARAAGLIKP
ncbi:MAG: ribonuclease HI family protein [Candidatus Omnitrophica bacterium]|nr:ribonuclease HI family protein [Candidatus Omnitrophota bacterium]MDD5237084.1 ribonuclease HI family protein [Candidatus Omnitrophota bacterium]MDD5610963.1 ribonuclease HI family protein [Candidatus Omnitrophota bacterium]